MDARELQKLRQYQLRLLPLLQTFDEFCRQHKIQYYLVGGSALGAVRHQGFIPWDDDIDVGLPRSELVRLEQLMQTHQPPGTTFEPCDAHRIPHPPFAYLSFENPVNGDGEKLPCIDIFPLDGVPSGSISQRIQRYAALLYHLSILQQVPVNRGRWAALAVKLALAVTPKAVWRLLAKWSRKVVMLWDYEQSTLIANIFGMAGYYREVMPKSYLGKPQLKTFEHMQLPIPEQYDGYLKHLYGNYMQPPPEHLQTAKHQSVAE